MEATPELKRRLEDAGRRYHKHRTKIPIRWRTGAAPAASPHGFIYLNNEVFDEHGYDLDEVDEYRLLRKTMAHEVGHFNHSVLTGKRDFAAEYPELEQLAGKVCNIMEDAYVDEQVKREYPGLRSLYAFYTSIMMDDDDHRPPVDSMDHDPHGVKARIEGLVQLMAAGWVKGFSDADEDVRTFLGAQRDRMEAVRDEDDPAEREKLMHRVMSDLEDDIPEDWKSDAEKFAEALGGLLAALNRENPNPDRQGYDGDGEPEDEEKSINEENTDEEQEVSDADVDALDALDGMDMPKAAGVAGNVPDTDRIDEPDPTDRRDYESLISELEDERAGLPQRKANRELRDVAPRNEGYRDILRLGEETGVIEEVVERFSEIASDNENPLAEQGDELDIDQVVAHASGDVGVREFYREEVPNETGDRAVNVTLDASGSMSNRPMMNAKLTIAALAEACQQIGDDFCANTYSSGHGAGDNPDSPFDLRLVTSTDERFKPEYLDTFTAGNRDPCCAGVEDGMDLLSKSSKSEKVMFVITDGRATMGAGGGGGARSKTPVRDAREAVNKARNEGITVVGIGMGGISRDDLDETFGSDGYVVTDRENLADDVVEQYRRTLKTEHE